MKPFIADRREWTKGPWDDEPEDRITWEHCGIACLMLRNEEGAWCGYVGVQRGHLWFKMPYGAVEEQNDIGVHGGLTYSTKSTRTGPYAHPEGTVWWLGFDTAHTNDLKPVQGKYLSPQLQILVGRAYRTRDYVRAHVERLAKIAADAKPKSN